MKMKVPGKVALIDDTAWCPPLYDNERIYYGVPIVMDNDMDDLSIEDFFVDTDGRQFNDCAHAKLSGRNGEAVAVVQGIAVSDGARKAVLNSYYAALDEVAMGSDYLQGSVGSRSFGRYVITVALNHPVGWGGWAAMYPAQWTLWLYHDPRTLQVVRYTVTNVDLDVGQLVDGRWEYINGDDPKPPSDYGLHTLSALGYWHHTPISDRTHFFRDIGTRMIDRTINWVVENMIPITRGWHWRFSMYTPRLWTFQPFSPAVIPRPSPTDFLFQEPELVKGVPGLALGRCTSYYWKSWLQQRAYLAACDSLPRMSDNNVSNIVEIISFMYSVIVLHKIDMPKSLSSAWLAYRYQYTTTKMDVKEAAEFVNRHYKFPPVGSRATLYGEASRTIDGVDVTCRCTVKFSPRELGYLEKAWRALYTYGLQPNFYMVWDMIPYSFIVDWFIPIGEIAHVADARMNFNEGSYDIQACMFSFSYLRETADPRYRIRCYSRLEGPPQELNGLYWFDTESSTSSRTKLFRVLDTASLLLG